MNTSHESCRLVTGSRVLRGLVFTHPLTGCHNHLHLSSWVFIPVLACSHHEYELNCGQIRLSRLWSFQDHTVILRMPQSFGIPIHSPDDYYLCAGLIRHGLWNSGGQCMNTELGIRVIDGHAHFITLSLMRTMFSDKRRIERMRQRIVGPADLDNLQIPEDGFDVGAAWVEEMNRYGISAIGMMVAPEAWDEFVRTRDRYPGRFIGYINVNPSYEDAVELVKRAGREHFQGIKLYPSSWNMPAYDPRVYPIYEEALRQRLLVILHFGVTIGTRADLRFGNPLDIQRPAQDFPDLNFMIAHFGAGFFREVLLLMYQTDNILVDTSGSNVWMNYQDADLTLSKVFEKTLRAGSPYRVVFGTDSSFFPRGFRYNILKEQYLVLKSLAPVMDLSEDDLDLIFYSNILRLTGFRPSV